MNLRSIPSRVLRRLAAPVVRAGSVVFFERELDRPVPRAQPPEGFVVRLATPADLPLVIAGLPARGEAMIRDRFARGDLCVIGIDPRGLLAHASWVALQSAFIPELQMTLSVYPGEAYGYDFFTRADLRGARIFAAARQVLCDHLRAMGLQRFFTYVVGENQSGRAGASTWQKETGRLRYLRMRGTPGVVWGSAPFTLSRGQPAEQPKARQVLAAGTAQALRVEVISDASALLALQPVWDDLMQRSGVDHPFLSHAWITSWWEAFGAGRGLRVLAVYAGEKCIALAPLMMEHTHVYGIPVRSLELLANEHTPRSGFLVSERSDEVCRALIEAMNQLGDRWEMVVLPQLADGTQTLELMERMAKLAGIATGIWRAPVSPRLELRGDWEAYLKSLRPKQRTNLRNRLNRLKRIGPVEFEEVTGGDALHAALEEGLNIEAAAWKGAGGTAISSRFESNRFYRRFAEAAAQAGWLTLDFLKVNGKRIAFSYGLRFHGICYLLKMGYDPEYGAASPSQVLCAFTLQAAYKRGDTALDFLGADEPWKHEWTAEARPHSWLYLFQPGWHTWPIHFAKFRLLPALRQRWSLAAP